MKRTLLWLSATLLACIAYASPASAAHVSCADVLTQDTRLDSDLVNCPGDGVVVGADNITLDLAGHTIDGTGGADGGQGVDNDEGHDGVEVRGGRIQEFQAAVYFDHGDGGRLHGLTIPSSGAAFQFFDSDSNTIERNVLSTGIALYADSDGNTIDRNRGDMAGTGVLVVGFPSSIPYGGTELDPPREADGNVITRNRLIGTGDSFGIYVSIASDTVIEGNHVLDHSGTGISLNGLGLRNRIERNIVSRTAEGIALDGFVADTLVGGNRVTDSGADGIRVGSIPRDGATLIERNVATRNGDDGLDVDLDSATITRNTANFNGDLGIEAVPGVTDGGGNKARGNGNPAQCVGVTCR